MHSLTVLAGLTPLVLHVLDDALPVVPIRAVLVQLDGRVGMRQFHSTPEMIHNRITIAMNDTICNHSIMYLRN
jgi:hypothetical protein